MWKSISAKFAVGIFVLLTALLVYVSIFGLLGIPQETMRILICSVALVFAGWSTVALLAIGNRS